MLTHAAIHPFAECLLLQRQPPVNESIILLLFATMAMLTGYEVFDNGDLFNWKLAFHSLVPWGTLIPILIFKPPPLVGAVGGYMFSGRPSVRASVIHVVVLCFRDISRICWRIFAKLLSLVRLGTEMTWLRFWVKRSKFKVTPSRRRRTALDASVECNFF